MLVISILGPELGIKWVTLLTAFGIAFVKAYIVAAKFMHLNIEKKFITYMLLSMVLLMVVFFAGTMNDVMTSGGQNWQRIPIESSADSSHGSDHGDAADEHH